MADFNLIQKIKTRMAAKEHEATDVLKEAWSHFREILEGRHRGEKIWGSMEEQMWVVNGYLKNVEDSINREDHAAALRWLESAEKSSSVIKEFEEILGALETKELRNIIAMKKESEDLKRKIEELKRTIDDMQKAKAA